MAKGRIETMVQVLTGQLTEKFGPLSGDVLQRLAQADFDTLSRWSRRLLSAPDLATLFDSGS